MKTETYDTVIDGKPYKFSVKWDGFVWIARSFKFGNSIKVTNCSAGNNPEEAALKLVRFIERKTK